MNRLQETLQILTEAAEKTDAICVAYSGGKDSLCVLDLCCRSFKRVEAFHMYFIPGLRMIEEQLDYARQRWGIPIRQYPHWTVIESMKTGTFCPNHYRYDDIPNWKLHDIYALAMMESNTTLMATGAKRADSLWRRKMLKSWGDRGDVIYPCIGWNMFDVMAYMKAQKIPTPASSGANASGIDMTIIELLHLYDNYPDDFEKLSRYFPYAPAVVYRRKWYGVGSYKTQKRHMAKKKTADAALTPSIENYEVVEVHRSKLVDAPYNPRVLPLKAREKLKAGISKLGLLAPPVWNTRTGHIVSGHQRVSILDSIKGTADYTLKVAKVDLDDTREKEANLLLNNPEAQGEWDLEKLEGMLHTDGIDITATGFDVADVYRLFGDAPMSTSNLDELAERLASAREGNDQIMESAAKRDEQDFYIVVVFKDVDDRETFLRDLGLDSNRFQDGRKIKQLCTEAGNIEPRQDDDDEEDPRRTRKELGKLREVARHYLEGQICSMCEKPLLDARSFVGHEAGSGRGAPLPAVTDLAEHHKDGNHDNNAIENRELVHHICHKKYHGESALRY